MDGRIYDEWTDRWKDGHTRERREERQDAMDWGTIIPKSVYHGQFASF